MVQVTAVVQSHSLIQELPYAVGTAIKKKKKKIIICNWFCLFVCLFYFFVPHLPHREVSRLGALAASLHQSHSNTGSKQHLRPTPQLMTMLDP